ncbi:hypothetical protein niasHT_031025 [Heterodera trifolii]|uniref:DNA-directed DNA polymerase n=1 Tax=Heterodera trifolii TaxID=157864 RepID=A0ABD2HU28_9BILA
MPSGSDRKRRTTTENSSKQSQTQPKQPRWDFRSMSYFEKYPTEPQMEEEMRQLRLAATNDQTGTGDANTSADSEQQQQQQKQLPLYKEITNHVHKIERFSVQRHVTEFLLNAQHDQPDEALRQAFDELIARAVQNAENKSGRTVSKLGIMVSGKVLNDPVVLPMRPPIQNNVDVVMAELDKLGQSEGDEGGADKKTLLLSEPVEIIVTCLTPPVGSAPRLHPYQNWGYDEAQRIRIRNNDSYCLFHALVAGRAYHDRDIFCLTRNPMDEQPQFIANIMNRQDFCKDYEAFNRLVSNIGRMQTAVEELMNSSGIQNDKTSYGIEHIQHVQQYWTDQKSYLGQYGKAQEDIVLTLRFFCPTIIMTQLKKCIVSSSSVGNIALIVSVHTLLTLNIQYIVKADVRNVLKSDLNIHARNKMESKFYAQGATVIFFHDYVTMGIGGQHVDSINDVLYAIEFIDRIPARSTNATQAIANDARFIMRKRGAVLSKKSKYQRKNNAIVSSSGILKHDLNNLRTKASVYIGSIFFRSVLLVPVAVNQWSQTTIARFACQNDGALERAKEWSEADGEDQPVASFVEWVLRAWNKQYNTYIWAHNASRFDGHFALNHLCKTARRPDVVMNGLKIFEFRVQHSRKHSMLIWRDSCLIMPIALAELKKTFNLDCDDKPFFPYAFNRKENYTLRMENLPDESEYEPGTMKADKYEKFKKWYNDNKKTPFYLPDELRAYCLNDTEILLKALIKFRQILMNEITDGFDVVPISCTIASACMNIFKAQFMEDEQLAMVPELGYERNDRASVLAIKYLDWRAKSEGIEIQHAGNGREKRWKQFKLDGWIESQQRCIEVLGCYWHGCERCFKPDEQLIDGKTCRELNDTTQDRLRQLREYDDHGHCLQVEEIWECEINDQLKKNERMKAFFDDLSNERGPLDPRLAYCGGRTGPLRLFAEPAEDEKISVFDIVSLYPWVNYDTDYPIGIPTIIHTNADEKNVNWTKPEHLQYRGLYRVRVIPPRGLRVPVLPMKIDERLLFSCCHRCAALFRKCVTRCSHKCTHSDQQRAFTGNFTHIELEKALELGYVVDRFWRAWHYAEWSDQIFKGYVRQFIRLKVESSGFPEGVETSEQKQHYIDEYRRIYGVDLDFGRIKKNPGLRFIAKLMLNNAAIRVMYKPKKNFVVEHTSSNIVLSLWTTSRARLKLFDYMQQCYNTPGAELLYTDTDSVIVRHKRNIVPVETGEFLGQMSEEYADYDIETFACGGAKQYALKMVHKQTKAIKYVQKIRGITFDVNNSQALQFERFVHKVLNYGKKDEQNDAAVFNYKKIQPTKDSRIITRKQNKRYLPVCQKGIITENLDVLPFGYE